MYITTCSPWTELIDCRLCSGCGSMFEPEMWSIGDQAALCKLRTTPSGPACHGGQHPKHFVQLPPAAQQLPGEQVTDGGLRLSRLARDLPLQPIDPHVTRRAAAGP